MRHRFLTSAAVLIALVVPAGSSAAPAYEVLWRDAGSSAPYDLYPFEGGQHGSGVFAVGYVGGAVAVGSTGQVWRAASGNTQTASSGFGDVTGDGTQDVIHAYHEGNRIHLLDGADGSVLASNSTAEPVVQIQVADAVPGGDPEIYTISRSSPQTPNLVQLRDSSLDVLWSVALPGRQGLVLGSGVGDLDGDGAEDVVFGTYAETPRVYAFSAQGEQLWSVDLGGSVQRVEVMGDLVLATRGGSSLSAIDGATGELIWTLPGVGAYSALAMGDLDGDGDPDAAWSQYGLSGKAAQYSVTAVEGRSGVPMWVRPTVTPAKEITAGDLDGDGDADVVVSTQDVGPGLEGPNSVWAYEGASGRPLWNKMFAGNQTTYLSSLVLADVADEPGPEVIVASYFDVLQGLSASSGEIVWTAPLGAAVGHAVTADLDGDGVVEVATGSEDFRVLARDAATGGIRWSRDVGGQVRGLTSLPKEHGADLVAIGLETVVRLDGDDGEILWEAELGGMGTDLLLMPDQGLVIAGARVRNSERGYGGDTYGGHLAAFDASTGLLRWRLATHNVPWFLASSDADDDAVDDLIVGTPQVSNGVGGSLAAFSGASLGVAPVPLWVTPTSDSVIGMVASGNRILALRAGLGGVAAYSKATGQEIWSTRVGDWVRYLGSDDVDGDGTVDMFVGWGRKTVNVTAVSGADGSILFDALSICEYVTSAAWTDVDLDGAPDLLVTSDGGTYGDGGVYAYRGGTLAAQATEQIWHYADINAWDLLRVPLQEGTAWLAHGVMVRPDAVTMIRPLAAG